MADEAFALSPINARAAQPNDADYDAICSAFLETARGRWFLGEYAKRNRNSDTRLVLDAVERIEASLESQKQMQIDAQSASTVDLWLELAKILGVTRIEIAQHLLRDRDGAALETIRSGAETIRSVSWALRERGFDSRICDVFDAQVKILMEGHAALDAVDAGSAERHRHVLAAVDHLIESARALTSTEPNQRSDESLLDEMVDAVAGAMADDDPFGESGGFDTGESEPAYDMDANTDALNNAIAAEGFLEIRGDEADFDIVDAPIPEPPAPPPLSEPEINKQLLYEAKLTPYVAPEQTGEDAVATTEVPVPDPSATASTIDAAPPPPERTISLGHAALASGAVARPVGTRPDPLAPFRRMSQAEKIAFFS